MIYYVLWNRQWNISVPNWSKIKRFLYRLSGDGTDANFTYFSRTGCNLASKAYSFWYVYGPTVDPNYASGYTNTDAYNWGKTQAIAACNAWVANRQEFGLKSVMYADVEWDLSIGHLRGWLNGKHTLNYKVFAGFIDYIEPAGLKSGCYTSPGCWGDIFGSSFSPNYATYLWFAGNLKSDLIILQHQ